MVFGIGFYILRVTFTRGKGIIPITSLLNLLTPHVVLDQNRQYAACGNSFLCFRVLHPTWIFTWFYNIWLTSADINAVKSDQRLCSSSNILGSHDLLIYYWRRLRLFAVWHCSTLHSSAPIQNLEGSLWIFDIVVVSLHLGAGVQHTSPTLLSTSPALFIRPGRVTSFSPASCPFSSGLSGAASVPKLLYVAQNQP